MQIVPTLGPKVYKYYLLWAFWSPREIATTSVLVVSYYISSKPPKVGNRTEDNECWDSLYITLKD